MSNLTRRLRSGRRLQSPPKNPKKSPLMSKKQQDQNPPPQESPIHHPQPAPPTRTASDLSHQWKNLDNPYSYSGNTATILDQIKSFSVHKPRKNSFKRRHVIVPTVNHTVMADLIVRVQNIR